jgi:hypothetical protein
MEEKHLTRDLTLRLEVLNVLHDEQTLDEIKDNSTLDADSLPGDPFEEDLPDERMGMRTVCEEDQEEEEGEPSGWLGRAWQATRSFYNSWTHQP